jgi:uncharacterized protein YeeX (DUF496 family)
MGKIVRLTETDMNNLVKKIVSEQKKPKYEFVDEHPRYKELKTIIKELKKIINSMKKDFEDGDDYIMDFIMSEL